MLSGSTAPAGIAMINSIGNLGSFFGPYILGSVKSGSGSFRPGLLIVAAVLAASGCIALIVRPGSRRGGGAQAG